MFCVATDIRRSFLSASTTLNHQLHNAHSLTPTPTLSNSHSHSHSLTHTLSLPCHSSISASSRTWWTHSPVRRRRRCSWDHPQGGRKRTEVSDRNPQESSQESLLSFGGILGGIGIERGGRGWGEWVERGPSTKRLRKRKILSIPRNGWLEKKNNNEKRNYDRMIIKYFIFDISFHRRRISQTRSLE